tara:strand:- start:1229 stop:1684 length:456 start_codon:yes stop_codon:yes gene_type:complete
MRKKTYNIFSVLHHYFNSYPGAENRKTHDELLRMVFGDEEINKFDRSQPKGILFYKKLWTKIYYVIKHHVEGELIKICYKKRSLVTKPGYFSLRSAREGKEYADHLESMSDGFKASADKTIRVAKIQDPVGFEELQKQKVMVEEDVRTENG